MRQIEFFFFISLKDLIRGIIQFYKMKIEIVVNMGIKSFNLPALELMQHCLIFDIIGTGHARFSLHYTALKAV